MRTFAAGGSRPLAAAGIEVTVGVCQREASESLAPYIKLRTLAQPWVIAKWAQTADGCLALPPQRGRWISNEFSRAHLHRLRGVCDGILVGIGTVLADDPMLTARGHSFEPNSAPGGACNTHRGQFDMSLKTSRRRRGQTRVGETVQTRQRSGPTRRPTSVPWVCLFSGRKEPRAEKQDAPGTTDARRFGQPFAGSAFVAVSADGAGVSAADRHIARLAGATQNRGTAQRRAEVLAVPELSPGRLDLQGLLTELGRRQWTRLLVEGGAAVLRDLLAGSLADELLVYVSPTTVGTGRRKFATLRYCRDRADSQHDPRGTGGLQRRPDVALPQDDVRRL